MYFFIFRIATDALTGAHNDKVKDALASKRNVTNNKVVKHVKDMYIFTVYGSCCKEIFIYPRNLKSCCDFEL